MDTNRWTRINGQLYIWKPDNSIFGGRWRKWVDGDQALQYEDYVADPIGTVAYPSDGPQEPQDGPQGAGSIPVDQDPTDNNTEPQKHPDEILLEALQDVWGALQDVSNAVADMAEHFDSMSKAYDRMTAQFEELKAGTGTNGRYEVSIHVNTTAPVGEELLSHLTETKHK